MIDDVFSGVEQRMSKALYADDGVLWVRGRNIGVLESRMQKAIDQVRKCTYEWGVRLSV